MRARTHTHTYTVHAVLKYATYSAFSTESLMANKIKQSVTGWRVWGSKPGVGETFCMCPDCPKAHLASRTTHTRTLSQGKWPEHGIN
jgi:hypothetical protein